MNSLHVKIEMPSLHEKQTKSDIFHVESQSCEAMMSKLNFPWYMYSNTHLQ